MLQNFLGNVLATINDDTDLRRVKKVDVYQPSLILVLLVYSEKMVQKEVQPVSFHIVP